MAKVPSLAQSVQQKPWDHYGKLEKLGKAALITAGLGLGVFLFIGPLAHANLALRVTVLVLPTAVGLVAAKNFGFSTVHHDPNFVKEFLSEGAPTEKITITPEKGNSADFYRQFIEDVKRDARHILFQKPKANGKGLLNRFARIDLSESEDQNLEKSGERALELLRDLDLTNEEILHLSQVCQQGLFAPGLAELGEIYENQSHTMVGEKGAPASTRINELGISTQSLWTIERRKGKIIGTIQHIRPIFKKGNCENPAFYVVIKVEVNLTTGSGGFSLSPPSKTVPKLDLP